MVCFVLPVSCLVAVVLTVNLSPLLFCDWKNATGTSRGALNRHSLSHGHLQCVEQAVTFIAVMEEKRQSIKSKLSDLYDKEVQQNTKAPICIIDVLQFLTKQGLALRGHTWNKGTKRESGNFNTLIDLMAKYHVPSCIPNVLNSPRNARYLSPRIQNELILINGDLIQKSIVVECNASLFLSVMLDRQLMYLW